MKTQIEPKLLEWVCDICNAKDYTPIKTNKSLDNFVMPDNWLNLFGFHLCSIDAQKLHIFIVEQIKTRNKENVNNNKK